MKSKNLITFLIALFIVITFLTTVFMPTAKASERKNNEMQAYYMDEFCYEEDFKESVEEEKILMFDSETGETTEIDIKSINEKYKNSNYSAKENIIENLPYKPKYSFLSDDVYHYVSNVSPLPHRAVCRIKADVYGSELRASGFLVGPKILLTSAHCVMNENDNDNFFADWVAYPGYKGGNSYKNVSSGWSKIIYPSNWKSSHSVEDDWCLCILNEDIGNDVDWLTCYTYNSNSDLLLRSVQSIGYPSNPGGAVLQYYTTGAISKVENGYFRSSSIVSEGMSGGPVIDIYTGFVIGIIKGYTSTEGVGVRITPTIKNLIAENF